MKIFSIIIILIILAFLICNCKKLNDVIPNKYYTDLNDTLIKIYSGGYGSDQSKIDLDIDKDKINDLSIIVSYSGYHFNFISYIQLFCQNGYEIAYSRFIDTTKSWTFILPGTIYPNDTLIIPKEYKIGDTIKFDDNYTGNSLMIRNYTSSSSPTESWYISLNYGLPLDKYLYIAFRNVNKSKNILAWLRLKVNNSSSILLNSCNFIDNKDIFIIE